MNDMPAIQKLSKELSFHKDGAHVLYIFNEISKYVENAASFIYEGIVQNSVVFVIVHDDMKESIKECLVTMGLTKSQLHNVKYHSPNNLYILDGQFNDKWAVKQLKCIIKPYVDNHYKVWTWGDVPFPNEASPLETLLNYERSCDDYIFKNNILSVCTYYALSTPAYVQNELMKTHTHFMIDDQLSISPFYSKDHLKQPSVEEIDRIKKVEQLNHDLKTKNHDLLLENNLIKLKHEIIQLSEFKLRTIINELPIPVIIRKRCTIRFLNKVAKEQFAMSEQGVEEEGLKSFFEGYDHCLEQAPNNQVQQHQFVLNNEKKKYYVVKSIAILFEKEPAVLHSFVDITQEKENELLMIRSEKMNITGELAASIAHELRNPLTAIKGFFDMLKRTKEEKELYYTIIEDELSRIEQISSELLILAKPHSENRKKQNIIQLMNDVKLLLTSQANMKSIELVLHAENEEIFLHCEVTKIKQVFINLIKNAIEAMEEGGSIVLKVNAMTDYIQIQVIDEGCGIPEELLTKIGEPFYTTKDKGTGIGLMVCFQIIESHGGTIAVDSQTNVGTTFTITLPVHSEEIDLVS